MKGYCTKCQRPTNQNVLKEQKLDYHDEDSGWWEQTIFQIIQCYGCDEISFRKLYTDVQINQYAEDKDDEYVQELYPKRGPKSIPIKNFNNLPLNIKSIYRETIDAYNNDQIILCCAGLRTLIESICLEKSINGRIVTNKKGKQVLIENLEAKIEGLSERGYLTAQSSSSLHELRFIGNEALHSLEKPSIEELKLAIQIIELIIENIFELQHKVMKIKRKKEDRKSNNIT
ncbi:MAG: DUF4145 domain-containing protein [Bacteroidota bacterium]|nr:DUF4145 domain-containing protein [Bacteroidota bacterium]